MSSLASLSPLHLWMVSSSWHTKSPGRNDTSQKVQQVPPRSHISPTPAAFSQCCTLPPVALQLGHSVLLRAWCDAGTDTARSLSGDLGGCRQVVGGYAPLSDDVSNFHVLPALGGSLLNEACFWPSAGVQVTCPKCSATARSWTGKDHWFPSAETLRHAGRQQSGVLLSSSHTHVPCTLCSCLAHCTVSHKLWAPLHPALLALLHAHRVISAGLQPELTQTLCPTTRVDGWLMAAYRCSGLCVWSHLQLLPQNPRTGQVVGKAIPASGTPSVPLQFTSCTQRSSASNLGLLPAVWERGVGKGAGGCGLEGRLTPA